MSDIDCFVCVKHARGDDVPGGVIYENDLVYAGHILPPELENVYLGYVMVEPKRHVAGLGQLSDTEAAALGQLVNRISAALRRSESAEHVYGFVLGDTVHLHIHVVPRYPATPRESGASRAPNGRTHRVAASVH